MSEIDKYLDRVCHTLGGSRSLRRHVREELREHIEDSVAAHVAAGLSPADATRKALDELGSPETVGEGLEEVHGHSLMALVVDRAMDWKERTMKNGWKWSFVAAAALFVVIAAEVAFIMCMADIVFPTALSIYVSLGLSMPRWLPSTSALSVISHVLSPERWMSWSFVGMFLAAWALFERYSRSENKTTIRLGAGALVAALLMVAVWATTFVGIGTLGCAIEKVMEQDPQPTIATALTDAEGAMAGLSAAVNADDWTTAMFARSRLVGALDTLRSRHSPLPSWR